MNDWFHIALTGLLLFVTSNLWLILRVLQPLRRRNAQADRLARGDFTALQQPCGGIQEIAILQHNMASMAGHVRRAQGEGIAYRHALTDGQEAERARIAHELHDDTVQALVAIAQSLDLASIWVRQDPERTAAMLKTARTQAVETVEGLRRLVANLRPPALEELGLIPALKMLAENERDAAVSIRAIGNGRRLDEARELTLFRSVQEAIHNAQRHGNAKHIIVEVQYNLHEIRLRVQDDGVGFPLPEDLGCLATEGRFGLIGIRERVRQIDGEVHMSSKLELGTELIIILPLDAMDQPTEAVRDPVCGAIVQPHQAYGSVQYKEQRYYFCCPVCQGAFQADPDAYLTTS